jgi:hypothetical protein
MPQCRARHQAPCSPGRRLIRGRALAPALQAMASTTNSWVSRGIRAGPCFAFLASRREWLTGVSTKKELAHWRFRANAQPHACQFQTAWNLRAASPAMPRCHASCALFRAYKMSWAPVMVPCSAAAALLCHASETFLRASSARVWPRLWPSVLTVSCRPSLLFVSPDLRSGFPA